VKARLLLISVLILAAVGCAGTPRRIEAGQGLAGANGQIAAYDDAELDELPWPGEDNEPIHISDPLRPVNRAFFHFNDKLYCWVLKPVAKGWGFIIPRPVRRGLSNVFSNLGVILRTFNCTAQGDFKGTGTELARFGLNTTVGVLGLWDPAQKWFGLKVRDEDFGQTLGHYGVGPGVHITLPFLGPSCLRDTIGLIPDAIMNPLTFLPGANLFERINDRSLGPWGYDDLKESALDLYIAVMNAYYQQRQYQVEEDRAP